MGTVIETAKTDDYYILPGEFTFCSRCGAEDTCRPGDKDFMCTKCLHLPGLGFAAVSSSAWFEKYDEKSRLEREEGQRCFDRRKALASNRAAKDGQ